MKKLIAILLIFIILCCAADRIVVLYPISSKSHVIAVLPIAEELAEKGHHVTIFSPFQNLTSTSSQVKNPVHEVVLTKVKKLMDEADIDWFAMQKEGSTQMLTMLSHLREMIVMGYNELVHRPEFLTIVNEHLADLFIVDALFNEFTYPIIDKLKVPFVLHCSAPGPPPILKAMGAPMDYAKAPTVMTDFNAPMTFFQRVANIFSSEIMILARKYLLFPEMDALLQKDFPGVRPISQVEREASLCLMNTHSTVTWSRSLPPTIVPIGALHTRPAKPLPEPFREFADGAKDGFIVFTLGSFVPVSSMPQETLDVFIRVFSKLPQRVIWKWEAKQPENVPSNILMVKWLPQQDLLGHPNAKVFITHGGMLGVQEAIYHAVPLLGLPFGNDQRASVAKAKRDGWGLQLDWDKIDEESLSRALKRLIVEQSFKDNIVHMSQLARDELVPARQVAVYWIEHVLRHGGTTHLQLPSRNIPFYQEYLLDVAALLFGIVFGILFVTYKFITCFCCRSSRANIERNRKKTQ